MTEVKKKAVNREYAKAKGSPQLVKEYNQLRRARQKARVAVALDEIGIDHMKIGTNICASKTCTTVLSRYNPNYFCARHEGKVNTSGIEEYLRKNHSVSILNKQLPKLELV
jgi:hypothetical protein